jgi:hypothetical protein
MALPEHTKKTRCDNNLPISNNHDFFRPIISNESVPINYNHECYTNSTFDLERSSISTRNSVINDKKPVQHSFQNNYHTMTFDQINVISDSVLNSSVIAGYCYSNDGIKCNSDYGVGCNSTT